MAAEPERQDTAQPLATQAIEEVVFDPARKKDDGLGARRLAWRIAGAVLALLLAFVLWFVFTARSVQIDLVPAADVVEFDSRGIQFQLGERYLVRQGEARLSARKDGYYPLEETVMIGDGSSQVVRFELLKKPGYLTVSFDREVPGAVISVQDLVFDGTRGELPAGTHVLSVRAPRFLPYDTEVEIEGGEVEQSLLVSLTPDWAEVTFESMPPGAEVVVDGEVAGVTPGTVEILSGLHEVALRAPGHKAWRRPVRAVANEPQSYTGIILEKADGLLSLSSTPTGASVAVDGRYKGQTPLELRLPPGKSYSIGVSRSGFETATRRVAVRADSDLDLYFELDALFGQVNFDLSPRGSSVFIDGVEQTLVDNSLSLSAVEQSIEVRAPGYVGQTRAITPNPAYAQTFKMKLVTREAAREAALKRSLTTSDGQVLALMRPGPFQMGASRRERGRRANEVLRDVAGLAEFYIATTEVTNERFRAFRPGHDSGYVYKVSLNGPKMPVVNVTVIDAIAYCNWLSEREELEPAYRIDGSSFERTGGSGYRLPTEAEWAWAARYADVATSTRYPWGNDMPPAPDSGNYADRSTIGLTAVTLPNYSDGFPASAPVGSFPESIAGLFDIGGNAAEWTEDEYTVGVAATGKDGGETYYVVRGSSWMHADISELRMTFRDFSDVARPDVGFRIARDLEEPEL